MSGQHCEERVCSKYVCMPACVRVCVFASMRACVRACVRMHMQKEQTTQNHNTSTSACVFIYIMF